ncbi:MAG: hypothetical protein C9356_09370 [Oleiphilus sp.]|nr:MAG: hypothetical protein C9356_09370 [Oleiphilus sp.]
MEWLPELVTLSDYEGDWDRYLEGIYSVFCEDFVQTKPRFRGIKLGLKRHPVIQGKEATFWHFISEGAVEEERIPDMRRCERIAWPSPVIENSDDDVIKVWMERPKSGQNRIHIWFENEGYIVVLDHRREFILPWTAFYIEREHQRKKYNKRWKRHGAYIGNKL